MLMVWEGADGEVLQLELKKKPHSKKKLFCAVADARCLRHGGICG